MFCSKCGYKMNDNDRFCPKCGNDCAPQPTQTYTQPAPQPVQQAQIPVQTQPVQQPTQQAQAYVQPVQQTTATAQQNATAQPKKKSKKPLIAVIAIVLVVAIVVGIIFMLPKGGTSSDEMTAVIKNQYGEYYFGGVYPVKMDGEEITALTASYEDEEDDFRGLNLYNSAYDGETFYGRVGDNSELYKVTFADEDNVNVDIWVDEYDLEDTGLRAECMRYFQNDGEYIYFAYIPGPEYFYSELENAYKIGRISKDGKDIFLYDITASTYAVKDGWIYYYDNGFEYSKSLEYYEYDEAKTSIGKIKVDETAQTTLREVLEENEKDPSEEIRCCDQMKIFGDKLYFLDYSTDGDSRVCRMNFDGSDVEYVSENGAFNYTVDTASNKLYYTEGELGLSEAGKRTMYEVDLSSKNENELLDLFSRNYLDFSIYNNYIYFMDYSTFTAGMNKPNICGMRYNRDTKQMETLMGNYVVEDVVGDDGFTERHQDGPFFYWEETEENYDAY